MATLVLGALGTAIGGPFGGALGAMVGRQVDASIVGTPTREGPRLKDLAVSTSSYGQPIARHFGTVRAPGTIVWSSDLTEDRETSGGGKGKPKTAQYSYTVSFAVALSSRPIDRIGRIWADGNLLRGAAGDLKTGGGLRIYNGHDDQPVDPLLSAVLGSQCSAHRGCAYVVFEDLALADFGNRIPALSFEIVAGAGSDIIGALLGQDHDLTVSAKFAALAGYSYDGGSLASVLALVDRLAPLTVLAQDGAVSVANAVSANDDIPVLSEAARWDDGQSGRETGQSFTRAVPDRPLSALRYYDAARDYQPGLQRADGGDTSMTGSILEFPGVFTASDAKRLVREASVRARARSDILNWRCIAIDPAIEPGTLVRAPNRAGIWRVIAWEWHDAGVELQLQRHVELPTTEASSDSGKGWLPPDRLPQPTRLRVFELPWDGTGSSENRRLFAAASAPPGPWSGAALYAQREGVLVPIPETTTTRAVGGALVEPLLPSPGLRFEPEAIAVVRLDDHTGAFQTADIDALARGANRLLVGSEVLQFAHAEPGGGGFWVLQGLLRGRGGSEAAAGAGHLAGTATTLLDDRLVPLSEQSVLQTSDALFAAIGLADEAPATAALENPGISHKPPFPVHGRADLSPDGSLTLSWTRRARGGWTWLNEVGQPLVERQELYEIGVGPVASPLITWLAQKPALVLDAQTVDRIVADYPGQPLWVRQVGDFAKSAPLLLTNLPLYR